MPVNNPSEADARIKTYIGLLGLDMRGDIGPYTCYTNKRGRVICYPRTPPTSPPTPAQTKQRLRFRLATENWKSISAAARANWEDLTKVLSLCCTGQNLFLSLSLKPQDANLTTAILRTGIAVSIPTEIPI